MLANLLRLWIDLCAVRWRMKYVPYSNSLRILWSSFDWKKKKKKINNEFNFNANRFEHWAHAWDEIIDTVPPDYVSHGCGDGIFFSFHLAPVAAICMPSSYLSIRHVVRTIGGSVIRSTIFPDEKWIEKFNLLELICDFRSIWWWLWSIMYAFLRQFGIRQFSDWWLCNVGSAFVFFCNQTRLDGVAHHFFLNWFLVFNYVTTNKYEEKHYQRGGTVRTQLSPARMRNEARHFNVTPRHWNANKKKQQIDDVLFLWIADVNMFTIFFFFYKQIDSYFPVT